MNRHLIIGLVLIGAGLVCLIVSYTASEDSGYRLVIRGTNISYGWLLVLLGGIRLIRSGAQNNSPKV